MARIHHPVTGQSIDVPEATVHIHERSGWERVDDSTSDGDTVLTELAAGGLVVEPSTDPAADGGDQED